MYREESGSRTLAHHGVHVHSGHTLAIPGRGVWGRVLLPGLAHLARDKPGSVLSIAATDFRRERAWTLFDAIQGVLSNTKVCTIELRIHFLALHVVKYM